LIVGVVKAITMELAVDALDDMVFPAAGDDEMIVFFSFDG